MKSCATPKQMGVYDQPGSRVIERSHDVLVGRMQDHNILQTADIDDAAAGSLHHRDRPAQIIGWRCNDGILAPITGGPERGGGNCRCHDNHEDSSGNEITPMQFDGGQGSRKHGCPFFRQKHAGGAHAPETNDPTVKGYA